MKVVLVLHCMRGWFGVNPNPMPSFDSAGISVSFVVSLSGLAVVPLVVVAASWPTKRFMNYFAAASWPTLLAVLIIRLLIVVLNSLLKRLFDWLNLLLNVICARVPFNNNIIRFDDYVRLSSRVCASYHFWCANFTVFLSTELLS